METTARCNLCGGLGGHQNGCSNRQGSGFTQSVYSYGTAAPATNTRPFSDLLEAAEEMYQYCKSWHCREWRDDESWKAAIEAAKAELEGGKR